MVVNLGSAKFFIQTPDGESVEIKGGVQEISFDSDQVVDSNFDKEYSGTFTYEEPQNIKELKELGFTERQARDIHWNKGESWKQS